MQAGLLNAEKLAISGQLGASLAHEINNPLQSVIGCLGLADRNLVEGADVTRYLQVAREELRRAAGIVAQFRDLHRISEPEQKKAIDLNPRDWAWACSSPTRSWRLTAAAST